MISRVIVILISVMFTVSISYAQPGVHTAKSGGEVIRLIRNEKLRLILPGAMRDNNVDMWIHVTRAGDPDPMAPHFGSTNGYLIFTDLGDRIERAVFGSAGAVENIDVRGSDKISLAFSGYDYGHLDPGIYDEITEFVAKRDPKTIAVNTSDWIATADGISYSQYLKLEKILGPKYSKRIVSAERVITTFRKRRILREVAGLTSALETHRQILERALSNEVITPGVTTIADVGMWIKQELFKRHMTGYGTRASGPRVLFSKSKPTRQPDVRYWINHGSYVLQRGDFGTYDLGVKYLDYFATDYKRNWYIMRKGETSVPEDIQHAFDRAMAAHEIFRNNIKVGRTVGQTKKAIISAMEDAGYIYAPFRDIGAEDYKMVQKALAKTDKSGFSFDFHQLGNYGGGSFMYGGPAISPYLHDRDHLVIDENNFFAFEYMVHTNLPNLRPGFPVSLNIEGDHIVSSRGVEFLHPPLERILLIR